MSRHVDAQMNEFLADQGLIDDRPVLDIEKIYWDADGNLRYGVTDKSRDTEVLDLLSADHNEETEEARLWMIIPSRWVRNWLLFAHMKLVEEPPGPIDMESLLTRDVLTGSWRPRNTLRPPGKGQKGESGSKPVAPKATKTPKKNNNADNKSKDKKTVGSPAKSTCCGGCCPSCASTCVTCSCCMPSSPHSWWSMCVPPKMNQVEKNPAKQPRPSLGPAAAAAAAAASAQSTKANPTHRLRPEDDDEFPGHYRRISLEAWLKLVELYGVSETAQVAVAVRGTPYHDLRRWRVYADPTQIDASLLPEGDGRHFNPLEPELKLGQGKLLKSARDAFSRASAMLTGGGAVAGGGSK